MESMLSGLVGSTTRIKLLVRLFANPKSSSYLRALSDEFGVSTNSVREELNRLNKAKLLKSKKSGREIHYQADPSHPLFSELRSMVQKVLGIDHVVKNLVGRLGHLNKAILIDDYAIGRDSGIIDLVLVGEIESDNLHELVVKTERYIKRKIRTLSLSLEEYNRMRPMLEQRPFLLLWQATETNDDDPTD